MANSAFGKSFSESFGIGLQKGSDASSAAALQRQKHKLKLEEDREKIELERKAEEEKTILQIETGVLDSTGLGRDTLKKLASRLSADEIKESAVSSLETRNQTRAADSTLLKSFVEDSKIAAEEGMSLAPTDEIREIMQRQGVSSLQDVQELTKTNSPIDRLRLLATTATGRSILAAEQEAAAERRADKAETRTEKLFNQQEEIFELNRLAREEQARNLEVLRQATQEELRSTLAGVFPGEGQIGGLFREGGTGDKLLGIGKRKITEVDKQVQSKVNRWFDSLETDDAISLIKAKGVSEQEVLAVMRKLRISKDKALKMLGITQDQIDKRRSK
jgi:hypothetical protein